MNSHSKIKSNVPDIHLNTFFKEIGKNAFVDWLMVLFFSVLIAIVLIIGGLRLYWEITSGNFHSSGIVDSSNKVIFDEAKFDSIVNYFKAREDISNQMKQGYTGPLDPSI